MENANAGWLHDTKSMLMFFQDYILDVQNYLRNNSEGILNVNFVPHLCFLLTRKCGFHLAWLLVLA